MILGRPHHQENRAFRASPMRMVRSWMSQKRVSMASALQGPGLHLCGDAHLADVESAHHDGAGDDDCDSRDAGFWFGQPA